MKEVSIYIQTNFKGLKKCNGKAIFILEYKTTAGTGTKTKIIDIKEATANSAELEALIQAVSRLKEKCEIFAFTDNKYVHASFENDWISSWIANDFKSAKGKDIANREKWEELLNLLNGHELHVYLEKQHEYKNWMQMQLK